MKQLDLGPDGYRKQDSRSGRWVQNVDRRFCRWMSLVGFAVCAMFAWAAWKDGAQGDIIWIALGFAMGTSSGALFTMSLKSYD